MLEPRTEGVYRFADQRLRCLFMAEPFDRVVLGAGATSDDVLRSGHVAARGRSAAPGSLRRLQRHARFRRRTEIPASQRPPPASDDCGPTPSSAAVPPRSAHHTRPSPDKGLFSSLLELTPKGNDNVRALLHEHGRSADWPNLSTRRRAPGSPSSSARPAGGTTSAITPGRNTTTDLLRLCCHLRCRGRPPPLPRPGRHAPLWPRSSPPALT